MLFIYCNLKILLVMTRKGHSELAKIRLVLGFCFGNSSELFSLKHAVCRVERSRDLSTQVL